MNLVSVGNFDDILSQVQDCIHTAGFTIAVIVNKK